MNDSKMDSSALTVGWIGTGRMGAAMAARLARAGVDLTVWNRTRAKAEPLAELGCSIADSIADLRDRDVVFTCLLYTSPSPRDRTRSRMPSSA